MPPLRHTSDRDDLGLPWPAGEAPGPPSARADAAVLDAARELVLAVGVRRTTGTDIARRAGVSRMTLYRHFPDVPAVLQALLTREFGEVVAAARDAGLARPTARERVVETGVGAMERLVASPLLLRLLDVDPELLLPYVIDRFGTSQVMSAALLREQLRQGQEDGSIRPLDPEVAGHVLQIALQSFVFSARVTARETSPTAVAEELRLLVDAYLRPEELR